MKKRLMKIATLLVAAVALVAITVSLTVAYLTSYTTVSNTFTVGRVGIHMYESSVNADGEGLADTDKNGTMKDSAQNTYTLIPGKNYTKDPTIYVEKDSAGAFLFVVIQNEISDIEVVGADSIAGQMEAKGWKRLVDGSGTPVVSAKGDVWFYAGDPVPVEGGGVVTTDTTISDATDVTPGAYDVFSTFTIRTDAVVRDYVNKKVELTAYAIQADTFKNEGNVKASQKAWAAIVATYPDVATTPTE